MNTREKGSTTSMALATTFLILLGLVGLGWWWHTEKSPAAPVATNTTSGSYTYVIGEPTATTTKTVTYTTLEPAPQVAINGVSASGGPVFHNAAYGLTLALPAGWNGYRSYETNGGPNGLPGTLQIHFIAPNESSDAFVVNVFSKEQWNQIRTQENAAHMNVSSLGEGQYLGENFTWIYSAIVTSHAAELGNTISTTTFY